MTRLKYVATLGRVLLAQMCWVLVAGLVGAAVLAATGSGLAGTVVFMVVLLAPPFKRRRDAQDDALTTPSIQIGLGVVLLSAMVLVSLLEACT